MTTTSELAARLRARANNYRNPEVVRLASETTATLFDEAADALDRLAVGGDMETTLEARVGWLLYLADALGTDKMRLLDSAQAIIRDFDRLQAQLSAANAEVERLKENWDAAEAECAEAADLIHEARSQLSAANDRIAALEAGQTKDHDEIVELGESVEYWRSQARTLLSGAQT